MSKALSANMKRDTVEKAIKRGAGANYNEVRNAFSKSGGNLGTDGSVSYLFTKIGTLTYPSGSDEDMIMEAGLETKMAEVTMHPSTSVELGLAQAEKIICLIDALEDLADVQNVYTNADFSDEVMQQLS